MMVAKAAHWKKEEIVLNPGYREFNLIYGKSLECEHSWINIPRSNAERI